VKRLRGFIFQVPIGTAVVCILAAVINIMWYPPHKEQFFIVGGLFVIAAGSILFAFWRKFWRNQ